MIRITFRRTPMTWLMHAAMAVIVVGALLTHLCGVDGTVTLTEQGEAAVRFDTSSEKSGGTFPFGVRLEGTDIDTYPGTSTPMDFRSSLCFTDTAGGEVIGRAETAMNRVVVFRGWRFCQSAMGPVTATFTVSHDPWGTGTTYAGYALGTIGLVGFLFQRRTLWRAALRGARSLRRATAVLLLAAAFTSTLGAAERALPAMQRPLARNLGRAYVLWNDRICPLQTMARDVTIRLYGDDTYRGLTAEQVLSGWLFYYDEWLSDYRVSHPDAGSDCMDLTEWLGTGGAFRIYPYQTADGTVEWLSLSGRRPSRMDIDQWRFMQTTMPEMSRLVRHGRNIAANDLVTLLISRQRRYAPPGTLPGEMRMGCERFYNEWVRLRPLAIGLVVMALAGLWYGMRRPGNGQPLWMTVAAGAVTLWLCAVLWLRGYVGGHLPLADGHETMLAMSAVAMAGAAVVSRRESVPGAALILVGGMALMVAVMGEKNPRISHLMPVLNSVWLSVHVMLVMTSYALCALMSVLGTVWLLAGSHVETRRIIDAWNRVILYPAVASLALGIMAGAVWANQSWGRYWGWDPKETCALVTLLVYALPLHTAAVGWLRAPRRYNLYLMLAILAVLFTYFGANWLMPGLHSYA